MDGVFIFPQGNLAVPQHFPQMIVIRKQHIRVELTVTPVIPCDKRLPVRLSIRRNIHISKHPQMSIEPRIHLSRFVRVDAVTVSLLYPGLLFNHRKFLPEIVLHVSAVHMHVKRKLLL